MQGYIQAATTLVYEITGLLGKNAVVDVLIAGRVGWLNNVTGAEMEAGFVVIYIQLVDEGPQIKNKFRADRLLGYRLP